jgi:hypothetical protein
MEIVFRDSKSRNVIEELDSGIVKKTGRLVNWSVPAIIMVPR